MTHLASPPTGRPLLQHGDAESAELGSSPIPAAQVLDGSPDAAMVTLTCVEGVGTGVWETSAGRFDWYYGSEEVIHVLDGEAHLIDDHGNHFSLSAGSVAHFSAGTHIVWDVPVYVRKLFVTLPADPISRAARALRRLALRVLRR